MSRRIYFDHNATTPVHPQVRAVMLDALENCSGNPSSVHQEGQKARLLLEKARSQVAALLGAKSEEIYFTSGGTESNNIALFACLEKLAADQNGLPEVITTPGEHPSVLNPLRHLERLGRLKLHFLKLDTQGNLDISNFENLLSEKTALVTIMLVNNELGTRYPVEQIARVCLNRPKPIPVHCDGVQAAGRLEIRVKDLGVSSFSLSAHKFYGPKGVGALWMSESLEDFSPRQFGGGQESGKRSGTENLPGILGLGKASELALQEQKNWANSLLPLRDLLERKLIERIEGVRINGQVEERIYSTTNVHFRGVPGDVLQQALDLSGIAVATGSACSSGTVMGSHVLHSLGQSAQESKEAIRISLGWQNTEADILFAVEAIERSVERIRKAFAGSKI